MPFSAHITDVIIKAGGAQNTLWLDCHKTPITFLVGLYPFGVFFPPLVQKTLQHSGTIWRVLIQKDCLCSH